jgi:hypothetical protein
MQALQTIQNVSSTSGDANIPAILTTLAFSDLRNILYLRQTSSSLGQQVERTEIYRLPSFYLNAPIGVSLQRDGDGFIAEAENLPLYGYGDTYGEALGNLKADIESLYFDLLEDDNFTSEWLDIKAYLSSLMRPDK